MMRRLLLLSCLLAYATPAIAQQIVAPSLALQHRVTAAIAGALEQRMGADAQVVVELLLIFNAVDAADITAVPGPDARTGEIVTFVLLGTAGTGASRRVIPAGRATARVRVDVPHAKAARLIARGTRVEAGDLEPVNEEVRGLPLRRLPSLGRLVGGRALRNIAPGEVATSTAIAATPAVSSGQLVRATATVDGAEVSAMVVAAQSGELGAIVRVVNRESRRELRARVIGDGRVEVIHD